MEHLAPDISKLLCSASNCDQSLCVIRKAHVSDIVLTMQM